MPNAFGTALFLISAILLARFNRSVALVLTAVLPSTTGVLPIALRSILTSSTVPSRTANQRVSPAQTPIPKLASLWRGYAPAGLVAPGPRR